MDYLLASPDQLKSFIKGARKKSGLTQEQLAAMLGVSQQAYQKIESNPEVVSFERIMLIFKLIGVELYVRDVALKASGRNENLAYLMVNRKEGEYTPNRLKRIAVDVSSAKRDAEGRSNKNQQSDVVTLVKATGEKVRW